MKSGVDVILISTEMSGEVKYHLIRPLEGSFRNLAPPDQATLVDYVRQEHTIHKRRTLMRPYFEIYLKVSPFGKQLLAHQIKMPEWSKRWLQSSVDGYNDSQKSVERFGDPPHAVHRNTDQIGNTVSPPVTRAFLMEARVKCFRRGRHLGKNFAIST